MLSVGGGCVTTVGNTPALSCPQLPNLGQLFRLRCTGLPAAATSFTFLGFDLQSQSPAVPLCSGCDLLVSPVVYWQLANVLGVADLRTQVPLNPELIGESWYRQAIVLETASTCFLGAALSNAVQITVGPL